MAKKPRPAAEKKADVALGRRLAKIRKQRGLTQVELAEKIGVIQSIISNYESGRLRPNPSVLAKLAVALQVSADEILGIVESPTNGAIISRRFMRRMKAVETLPKRDQDALLRTIDAFLTAREAS